MLLLLSIYVFFMIFNAFILFFVMPKIHGKDFWMVIAAGPFVWAAVGVIILDTLLAKYNGTIRKWF